MYRRSETEMPARIEEVKHAKQEGIDFRVLTNPVEFLDDGRRVAESGAVRTNGIGRAGRFGKAAADSRSPDRSLRFR